MKIKQIEANSQANFGRGNYKVDFEDGFVADISYDIERCNGMTRYTQTEANFSSNERELGSAYVSKEGRTYSPRKNSNTVAGENLDSVMEHLEAIQNNLRVQKNASYGESFQFLVPAVGLLIPFYQAEKIKYEASLNAPKAETKTEVIQF